MAERRGTSEVGRMASALVAPLLAAIVAGCTQPTDSLGDATQAAAATPPDPNDPPPKPWDGQRWTKGIIPYVIDQDGTWPACSNLGTTISDAEAASIRDALDQWEALTPLEWREHSAADPPNPNKSFVVFRGSTGSSADIRGMPLDGSINCVYIKDTGDDDVEQRRLVLHETGHAAGLSHEQQRPDRGTYVKYDNSCITNDPDGKLFAKDKDGLLLTPYDLTSVMQYGSVNSCDRTVAGCCDASADDCSADATTGFSCLKPPLLAKPGLDWIPTPDQLSRHDVNAMSRMYEEPLGMNNPDDALGSAFAVGDFDDDGYADLAVGAPGNQAVFLWKGTGGSIPGSLGRLVAWKVLRASDIDGLFSKGRFGASLVAADFDDDGKTDLAVGAPGADALDLDDGSVILYTSQPATEYTPRRTLAFWKPVNQLSLGLGLGNPGDHFGASLAAGDFDGDGKKDLAIGVPLKHIGTERSGQVVVMLAASPNAGVVLQPDMVPAGVDIGGARFGAALAAGKLNGDVAADLVVGSPETATTPNRSGAVYVFAGGSGGFVGKQLLRPSDAPAGTRLHFGAGLALGDFDHSGTRQLAVGAPNRRFGQGAASKAQAGGIYMFKPTTSFISFSERPPAVVEPTPVAGNRLGSALLTWVSSCSSATDCVTVADALVAGLPDAVASTGKVEIFTWTSLDPNQIGPPPTVVPLPAAVAAGNRMGAALAQGNFLPDAGQAPGTAELVVGEPGASEGAGAFYLRNFDSVDGVSHWHFYSQITASPE